MKRAALVVSIMLAGCSTGGGDIHEHNLRPGIVPSSDSFSVEAAERICSIDSLTQARNEWRSEIRDTDWAIDPLIGPDQSETGETNVQEHDFVAPRPYGRQTETVELVRAFETDLDAAYRFAHSSCQAYAVCMHQRGYEEQRCSESRLQWTEARADFYDLSERLADIRLAMAESCPECRLADVAPRRPGHHGRPGRPPHHQPGGHHGGDGRYTECDGVLGDVFTTSACVERGDYPPRPPWRRD
ncbi:hypothetical protein DDZ18_00990 [Marinicauda salina]|uniref:Lipoprotein n=1 Tax=Marinicauda salina TaxID=2135793 RepID=A0A2U2BW15_9PROT|nr:hypothetical protein [Marinicauda salina]PWE18215.1 hypothetical protein DDZ18_00990 [Marinicauda salina]